MDVNKIKSKFFKNILYKGEVDSTNSWAKRFFLKHADNSNVVFLSDTQTSGKGRYNHVWMCQPGKQINMSILLQIQNNFEQLQLLCICSALAVKQSISKITDLNCSIKWPNDILINNRKICGILCESLFLDKNSAVIVGIGINVNNDNFSDLIEHKATSLLLEAKRYFSRTELINILLENFYFYYHKFNLLEFCDIIDAYKNNCCSLNKLIKFNLNGKLLEAKAVDINTLGDLVVRLNSGQTVNITHGEIIQQNIYESDGKSI